MRGVRRRCSAFSLCDAVWMHVTAGDAPPPTAAPAPTRLFPSLLRRCVAAALLLQLPFIAQYRKEQCGELLSMRSSDEPRVVPRQSSHGGEQQPAHPDMQSYPPGTIKVCA